MWATPVLLSALGGCTTIRPLTEASDDPRADAGPGCVVATEICDGADNDCDGLVDENARLEECSNAIDEDCDGKIDEYASQETCNNSRDDDCDGITDESGTEVCGNETDDDCDGRVDEVALVTDSTCDGVDDDCDGGVDEDGECDPTDPPECVTDPCGTLGLPTVSGGGGRLSVTLGAHSQRGSCGGDGPEAQLVIDVAQTSDVFITTANNEASLDTVLYMRECGCGGAEIQCDDDDAAAVSPFGGLYSVIQREAVPPGRYLLYVDTLTGAAATVGTSVDVDVYISPAGLASDRCGNPLPVDFSGGRLTGSTVGYSADYVGSCNPTPALIAEELAPDRVYFFRIDEPTEIEVDGCGYDASANNFDHMVYIRSSCTAVTDVACDDDGCVDGPSTCPRTVDAHLRHTIVQPGIYYLFVDSPGDADGAPGGECHIDGDFDFRVTARPLGPSI